MIQHLKTLEPVNRLNSMRTPKHCFLISHISLRQCSQNPSASSESVKAVEPFEIIGISTWKKSSTYSFSPGIITSPPLKTNQKLCSWQLLYPICLPGYGELQSGRYFQALLAKVILNIVSTSCVS